MSCRYQLIFIVVFVSFLLIGCKERSNTEKQLLQAEALIMEKPDSSLVILENIDTSLLERDKDKALYGLLLTMAQDKNWRDPTNDSIINFAVDYFTEKGENKYKILSHYYKGIVEYNNKSYTQALKSYFKAKELAEKEKDFFYAGMACRGISDIFLYTASKGDELTYAQMEYDNFKKSGKQPFIDYALLDLVRANHNNGNIDETLTLADEVIKAFKFNGDSNLYYGALRLKGSILNDKLNNFQEAEFIYEALCQSRYASIVDSLRLGLNYIDLDKKDRANEIISNIGNNENPLFNLLKSKLYKKEGQYQLSLDELETVRKKENKILREKINLGNSLSEYMELNHRLDIEKAEKEKAVVWDWLLGSISLILLLLVVILYYKYNNKKQQIALHNALESLSQLKLNLNIHPVEDKSLTTNLREPGKNKEPDLRERLKKELLSLYERNKHTTLSDVIAESSAYRQIQESLEKGIAIPHDAPLWHEIERSVQEVYPDFKANLRLLTQSRLTSLDLHTALLIKCHFTPTQMSVLLGRSKGTIVSRRETLSLKIFDEKIGTKVIDGIIRLL